MKQAVTAVIHDHVHDSIEDARREIFDALGDISGFDVWGQNVLCAVYMRPSIRRSGLITGDVADDRWQGKVLMIVKHGNDAFPASQLKRYNGRLPQVGDFIWSRAQDGLDVSLRGVGAKLRPERIKGGGFHDQDGWPCRVLYGDDIQGSVSDLAVLV